MLKLMGTSVAFALALLAPAAGAHGQALGPDAAACRPGAHEPAVLVKVDGFKKRTGVLRVQVYGGNPADFLAKGKKLRRIDLPVTSAGAMHVCVALPSVGNYAVAVRHDLDGNGKSGWSDGGGFSRNPDISLTSLKPKFAEVVIPVSAAVRPVEIVLNYRQGLSIKPISLAMR